MSLAALIRVLSLVGALLILTPILGRYLAAVFDGRPTFASRFFGWAERSCYRLCDIDPSREMAWSDYAKALVAFNALGLVVLFLLLRLQAWLPLNPQSLPAVPWALAFNTAISFTTNTNWQAYAGETTLSYFSQMIGLTVQNFLSAATGCGVQLALVRGLRGRGVDTLGNFWVDLVRCVLYVLAPIAVLFSVFLVSQGVLQNLNPYVEMVSLEGQAQQIPMGPVASQVAIKQLGTNGGGYFGANSAHPFENPTALSNFMQTLCILLLPAALVYAYGVLIDDTRQGWLLFLVMLFLWLIGLAGALWAQLGPDSSLAVARNYEGIEMRLGTNASMLWTTATTATSNGSVNAMFSSLSPLAGGIALLNILLGEVVFGGIGVGMCGMLLFVMLAVFLSGLLVGRTPEYLGKKLGRHEMRWLMIALLTPGVLILIGAGVSLVLPAGLASLSHAGPHGLTEVLYAFSSAAGNNGSAFAGLNANTDYYNLVLGFVMLLTRCAILIPSLVIAGSLVTKKISVVSQGSLPTDTPLFAAILIVVILMLGALTFLPVLCLGPVVEYLLMMKGVTF